MFHLNNLNDEVSIRADGKKHLRKKHIIRLCHAMAGAQICAEKYCQSIVSRILFIKTSTPVV